jgi:mitochondrial import inner membrane translocase subunit TIM22
MVGFVFAGLECVIERERASHDVLNPMIAGGVAGGMLSAWSARQMGPQSELDGLLNRAAGSLIGIH